ncbi:hypothetical protein KP509_23G028700 [Ceratopteris richardii]|uniref:Uncharacterized protein n=1 Tax=Ceratopteris richardii TaxID=49495 RepID=A0A8T2S0W0_CERRI|nr:hypothetical protein KP509_23G028700 [Ceratopteris richardii]
MHIVERVNCLWLSACLTLMGLKYTTYEYEALTGHACG